MASTPEFPPDGHSSWFLSFERPGLRWPPPWPEGNAWLGNAILQLHRELDAVAALIALHSDPRVALDTCPAAQLLVASVDHLNSGAPTIDWRILFDRVVDFADELRSRNPLKGDSAELVEQLGVTRHLVGRVIAYDGEG